MPYSGKSARTGNSKGFRFESALFAAHPEFASGEFEADVIAPGRMLVRARAPEPPLDDDPVLDTYLAFVALQTQQNPEAVRPFTSADVAGLKELLEGIEYDADEVLEDTFELP
ncbi:MAG: type II toxin-antitoxin system PrlF family antitoxin [Gemmatimonadota bacterium]